MADTSYYDLYKALKADGAVQGDWRSFHQYVGAPGKQGYQNRKKLYDALKADGAVQASTYEEFNNRLFRGGQASLRAAQQRQQAMAQQQKPMQNATRTQAHARNNNGSQGGAATQQPQTAAQMALQMVASPQKQVQQPKQPRGKVSPFVQGLYRQDDWTKSNDGVSYTSPKSLQKKVERQKHAQEFTNLSAAQRIANKETWRREQPVVDTGSQEANKYVVKSQGQLEDEIAQSGKQFVDNNLGGYIDNAINQEFKDAHKRGLEAEGNDYFQHATGGADWFIGEKKYQQQVDPDAMIKSLSQKMSAFAQSPEFIKQVEREAASLGISPEEYAKSSVLPSLLEKTSSKLMNEDVMRRMPKGTLEYITGGILNSMTGALLTGLTTSKQQRQNQQQADALTEDGQNPNYQPGTLAKAARGTMAFVADAPAFGVAGKVGAKVAGKVLGAGAEQAAKVANMSTVQRMGYMAAQGGLSGGVTGFTYGSTNAAVQNFSTGEDTSLGTTLKLMTKGGLSEAASFAVMSGMGGAVGGAGYNIGISGMEKTAGGAIKNTFKKLGYEAVKTAMEGVGMWTGGNMARLVEGEDMNWSIASGLESAASAAMFKLMHAKDVALGRKKQSSESVAEYMKNRIASLFVSDAVKNSGYAFTTDEKNQLFGYGYANGMADSRGDILRWAKQANDTDPNTAAKYYDGIMKDPNVSWDTKAKFSALVMGVIPTARPMADHVTFTNEKVGDEKQGFKKYINEYAADGTLLSKHSYETKDERDRIMFRQAAFNEEAKLNNAYALAIGRDTDNRLTQSMFLMSKGYDTSLPETEPSNQRLILGLRDKDSELYKEFTQYCINNGIVGKAWSEVRDATGISNDEMMAAWLKEPYKRTDKEQAAMTLYRKTMSGYIFEPNKPHTEQSAEDGKDVVAENNLGTEQPNNQAVLDNLHGLTESENEMEQLMNSNDIFSDNFKKLQEQGLTHPQIYDWMIQNGMTEEDLAPYAHYMNAVAKVQGMQNATAQAINERVEMMAQDWGFHGTMDGQKADGNQVLYVQDRDGRMLIVGTGDVAYDPTDGHAKAGVGDMLVCLDPNTRETVYVRAEDTTLFQTQDAEAFKNEERLKLQQINSVPYNQAAQEQAAAEAAKPQPKETVTDGNQSGQPQQKNAESFKVANSLQGKVGGSLSKDEADALVSEMENRPEKARELPLTPENWKSEFGENGEVNTPLGVAKMGENQLAKMFMKGREAELGLVKPTLENPDVIIEEASNAKDGDAERPSSYLFVKTFERDGKKIKFYASVSVKKDGMEVVVSNHFMNKNAVDRKLQEGKVLYIKGMSSSNSSDMHLAEHQNGGSDLLPTPESDIPTGGKDTNISPNNNENNTSLTFKDGSAVPVDANGEPDFMQMTPEQGVEVYKQLFPKTYEAEVDNTIKMLEADLKKVQKVTPKANGVMARAKEQAEIEKAVSLAEAQLARAKEIKKMITSEKVAETVGKAEATEGANAAGNEAVEKFKNAPRLVGNKRTRTLSDGETKIHGHYEIVPAESLTPSHDAMDGYKKSAGFPVDENGRTVNDRDYEHDKAAQQNTDQMALKYNGQAIDAVPTVSDEGIVYDGNGRTMAGQKAAKEGTDGEYINDLLENAENFGFTREQIEQSGIEHPRLVLVTDERLPYDTATFAKFNRNEKKTQSNTEQAVAKAKTLTSDEVGSIIAEIEGNGSLDAFFNNSKAINDLVKTLVSKGIIGQNEVAELMEGTDRLSPQGKELVKNLLLGSIFKPETIRMLGIDSAIKNKAIAGIRAVMDNMKLGDYSLRDEIDQAVQLLYEARQGGNKVDTLLRTPEMFGENAADRYSPISQMMALALEGKVSDFRDLLNEYNREAAAHNTGEGNVFGDTPTKEELVKDYLDYKNWTDYDTRNSETEGENGSEGVRDAEPEAQGGNGEEVLRRGDAGETETSESERVHLEELGRTFKLGEGLHHNAGSGEGETPESEGAKLEVYAKESGIWRDDVKDYIENELGATYLGQGGESYVYEKGDAIYKDRPLNFNTIHESIDNFLIAHELSPESGYEIVAVGPKDKMGQYHVVLRQKKYAMDLEHPITDIEIDKWFADRGFKKSIDEFGNAEYRKGDILVTDGIDSNFARDPETGKIVPIDLQCFREAKADNEEQVDKLAGVETDSEQKIDDYIAEHYPHHNGVRARTKEEQAAYDAETEAMKNDETLKQMRKEADEAFDAAKENIPLMPKTPEPKNVIEEVAEEYKKDHPLTDEEISNTTVFDDLPEDQKQYCIDAALDYLHGEDTSAIAEAYYRNIFEKRTTKSGEIAPPSGENRTTSEKEDTTRTTNPMESIEKAAAEYNEGKVKAEKEPQSEKVQTRKQLESEKEAADNEFDAFMKELKKKRGGQLNSGFIDQNLIEAAPKMFSLAAKCAYTRIKLGMFDAKEVIKDLQKRFKEAFDGFDKKDVDLFYSQIMSQKWRDGDKRMSLNDWAEHYRKLSPEHQEKLVGDSKDAEDRKQKEKSFINRIQTAMIFGKFKSGIVGLRKIAEDCGLKDIKDTDIQELVETAVVMRARDIAASKATSDEVKFKQIKRLYENQPSLNQRDSERIQKQQYSTPAPYAFVADMYVKGGKEIGSALEPSAGNGMLTIGLPMDKVHVNDIDEARLLNLQRQGFKNISSQDGTQPFADKDVDMVVTNPPFGSATPKDYDGYRISSLEGQMAINALESMKDDGRAAIIIGGKTEYAKNGSLMPKDKAFLGYLYSHYNVEDVINVDGSLYAKQGTSYPTRIILINGRRLDENAFPPVKDKARAETVKDYDELYKRVSDDILRKREMQNESVGLSNGKRDSDLTSSGVRRGERSGDRTPDSKKYGTEPERSVPELGTRGSDERPMGETKSSPSEHMGDNAELGTRGDSNNGTDGGASTGRTGLDNRGRVSESSTSGNSNETSDEGRAGGNRIYDGGHGRTSSSIRQSVSSREGNGLGEIKKDAPKRELGTEKVKYVSQSGNPFSLNSVVPADQAKATKKALEKIGDVDQFLVQELGYNDKDDMYHALGSEQVDAVALAIHQAKQGNAFIIGDMTGIGKGRQAAAMIRYAYNSGKIPLFITAKKGLFSDMYRDLKSIGNSELRPFIWAAKDKDHSADMTDSEGNVVYKLPSEAEQKRVMDYLRKNGKLPDEYDYIVTTYDSFNSGTMEYENGKKSARKDSKGSKNGQTKRDLLEAIATNTNVIMDESHKAGGSGGGSAYLQYIVPKLNAITFLSATYAKRPDNMPIYALRTSMNQAGMEPAELIDAIKRGGATLQEIMSQSLAASGQFIRRERDMTGVTIDWKTIDDPIVVSEQREQYDNIIGLFNDIINFQRTYVGAYLEKRNEELAKRQSSINYRQGTADLGIHNTPFASRTYNMVQQVLLSLKAKEAAKSAIEHLKNGEKVVIALNNTNESQTEGFAADTEMDAPDLGVVLMKGLQGVLRYDITNEKGKKEFGTFDFRELGEGAEARYREIEENIKNASTGLSLSPIDVVKDELEAAGYKVGELTGRTTQFVKNPNGTVSKVKRTDTDKKKLALEFNTNKLDALILNRSASTGISLHDSSEYEVEHKPRVMIVVQQQADVNEEVQMRGRIDRTGQVNRGRYEYIVSQIPSEQRLLMMFKAKLKSLDANTTSSQKSKFNDMEVADIINKYGDKVVKEYMAEHLDLYAKMADPFNWEKTYGNDLSAIEPERLIAVSGSLRGGEAGSSASKLLGRMALLKVGEQEKMLKEINDLYAAEINRLNEMGENDLEITELPLKAKTIGKEVWKKGTEPDGDNAFADNTYIEKVNMAILKKPMKAQEVQKAQEGLTGGKSWDEYHDNKKAEVKNYFDQKIAEATQKNEERAVKLATNAKEKYLKDAKRGQKDSGMSDEQIEQMAGYQYDNIYKAEKEKLNEIVKNLNAKAEVFNRVLDTFNTEDAYVLPADMNNPNEMSAFGNSYGRLIDIKITDNFSPNASSVSFATLDGRRKITFPVSGKVGAGEGKADVIAAIDRMTRQASGVGDKHLRVLSMDTANWDKLVSNESRKDGYIITGNLMQALIDTKAQGVGGQLVKYTTDGGEVKTGILMPDRFEPKDVSVEAPISSVEEKFHKRLDEGGIESVKSSDGEVEIIQKYNPMKGDFDYQIRVPKSQKRGGKYFLDKELMSMMGGGNFETRGNSMLGEFKEQDLRPVLARLSNLGVKVREERPSSEEDGTHFRTDRGVQYSKTDEKDVKNSRIIPEDVDKSVSSQIEKKFDDSIGEIKNHANKNDVSIVDEEADIYNAVFSAMRRNEIENIKEYYEHEASRLLRSIGNDRGAGTGEADGEGRKYPSFVLRYQTRIAAAERELEYRRIREKALADKYGLRAGDSISLAEAERIFNELQGKEDKGRTELFQKTANLIKKIGTEFNGVDIPSVEGTTGASSTKREIELYTDTLVRTKSPAQITANTILHEMIHQATVGAINLVKKGKAEGMLTDKQIEAVNTIIDTYNKVTSNGSIVWEEGSKRNYGGKDEYEFAAEMSDPEQRKILDLSLGDRIINAFKELGISKLKENGLFDSIKNAFRKLFETSDKKLMDDAIKDIIDDFDERIDDISMNDIEQDGFAKKVEDKDELDRLNKEKTFRMYSGMQEVDGKLYSPMAAIIGGKRTDATEMGAWMKADERPDLVKNGKFTLVKTDKNKGFGEGDVDAAYNPYMHTSSSMMNDQFSGAYARGNIKVVEWEIPESEKTSGYHADGAKDAVGLVPWHSGSVNSLLPKDRQRQVMLSQYRKAVRIVPDSEVAESIAEQLKGTGLAIPWNVVTPNQVRELAKLGVPITTVESGKQAPETKAKFEAQMEELKEEYPQAKFVDVKMTKDAFKDWGKNGGTHFRSDSAVRVADDAPVVVKHVDQIAQKLGAKVNMVQSAQEITNKSAKAAIERGEKITGWYDEKTGEVHLYMPNIHDRYTAEKTIWHEVVGHKGMRELFGDENYSKFLRSIWYDLDKPENARLKELVSEELKYNPFDFENGIEEGIARLVEDGKGEPGFWNAIKNKVTDILHEIGYRIAPNTKDVKYLLWLGKNLQKNPNDPYWRMKAEAVRYKLDKENVPAIVEKDGVFYTNDGKARSFNDLTKKEFDEATDGEIHLRTTPSAGTALDRYHKALDAHGYMFTESYMDNMLSLKNLMQAIVPDNKNIADIKSSENPYILQNTMQGAMSNAAQMFERNVMKPLDKSMAEVLDAFEGKKDDEKIRNFNLYMITKHGLERNRILYMRDTLDDMRMDEKQKKNAEVIEKDWYDELASLNEQLDRGDIDLKGYFDSIDDFIRLEVDSKFDAGEHDYSGIHAIQGIEKSSDPYNDAEAIASVMDAEANMESIKKGSVKAYWDKVKAATQYAIDTDYKNGLISRELHGYVSGMFNWYVPLRKYDEATAEDTYGYITEKGDPKNFIGSSIMRARGHKYLSETNVLAQIGAMGNRAINNGGQNAIKQAFARFIRNHSDNNLVTETSVWYVDDPVTKTTKERYPEIPEDATPDEVNQIVADFNSEMRDLESKGLATKVRRRGRIGYKFQRAENKSQHIVDVKIAGKLHSFIINGNPRAAQALNGLLENWNGGNTKVAKWAVNLNGKIVRFFAQACTSYNPEFVMRNMVKDYEFSTLNLLAKEGSRYTGIFEKYYFGLVPFKGAKSISLSDFKNGNGLGLFAKYRNGTLDMNDKVQRYFKEFMENGGETGFVQMLNMKDWTKKYKTEINANRSNTAKAAKILKEGVFGTIEGLNEVAENMARFATYCASRDCNRTVTRSVYDAKEVTVNFNRHGSGSAITTFKNGEMSYSKAARKNVYGFTSCYLRHASMFFNAGIQSTNMLLNNAKSAPIATAGIIASVPFALASLMPLANQALMAMLDNDEEDRNGVKDPYAELPDYVRRNNLCVYVGGGEFVTVPLAIETRAFYGLGDLAAGLIQNPDERKFGNIASQSVGQIAQLVPIMDYMGTKDFGENPLEASFQAFSPSSAEPLIEWERNKDWKGQEIERRGEFYKNDPAWERANSGTNSLLMNANKFVNAETNDVAKGNEEMLGNNFLDQVTNPSMLEHFGGGITKGMGTFGSKVAGVIKKTWNGEEIETKDKPFIRSFFYTPSETSSMQRTKSKFYNYTEELSQDKANLDKLKSKTTDPMKAIQNASDYMKFIDSPKAQQIRILELADKQIKRIKKMRNKQTDTEVIRMADQQIGLIMQDAVEKMDKLE